MHACESSVKYLIMKAYLVTHGKNSACYNAEVHFDCTFNVMDLTLMVALVLLLQNTLSALPVRNCSKSLNLCTRESLVDSVPNNCCFLEKPRTVINASISYYLSSKFYSYIVDDCLRLVMYPGTYIFSEDASYLNFSVVITAPLGRVRVVYGGEYSTSTSSSLHSLLWFKREDVFLYSEKREFFVQLEGISFEGFQHTLQFDTMDYVGISNCNFT